MQNIVWIILGILGGLVLAYFLFGKRKDESNEEKNKKDRKIRNLERKKTLLIQKKKSLIKKTKRKNKRE